MGSLPVATAHASVSVIHKQDMSKEASWNENTNLLSSTDAQRHGHGESRKMLGIPVQLVAGAAYCTGMLYLPTKILKCVESEAHVKARDFVGVASANRYSRRTFSYGELWHPIVA